MMKGVLKRIFVQLMTLVLVLTSITLMEPIGVADAATEVAGLAEQSIGLSHDGVSNASWTASGTTITGTAKGTKGSCSSTATTTILTIQNKKESEATLSFDITSTLNEGSFKIGASPYTEGKFEQKIPGGGTITLTLKSPEGEKESIVTLSNVRLIGSANADVTFLAPEHGEYTVDGESVTAEFTKNKSAGESYLLSLTGVDSGYKFVGWYQNGNLLSENENYELMTDGNSLIEAKLVDLSAPILGVGGKRFFDWRAAIDAASTGNDKTIVVLKDSVILEGETYTIPSGVTLLVPFDDKHTCYTTKPEADTAYIIGREYCCLKIEGTLNVSTGGVISVSAKHRAGQGSPAGMVTGDYGHIVLGKNGLINLEEGASLYAYGYISGSGMVQAKSGSQVFEYFQMIDYRGGSATSNMLNNSEKVFPFSQYYVQNIESSLRIFHGATENLITSVNLTLVGKKTATVPFIGETGLFELDATDGYFEKKYNGLTDKLHIDICGSAHINPITIDVGASVDSSKYVLPITNSLNIEIKEGRFVATEDISLLPDVNLIIDNGAEFEISEGKAMYVYDRDEWVGKSFVFGGDLKVSPYAISRSNPNSSPRSSATLQDAEIDVNGIMRATGNIYTTASGANITSSNGTGKIHILSEGGNHELYEYRQSDSQYANIEITGMMLKNAEGSYTETATAAEGSIYDYIEGEWGLNGVARSPKADISSGTYETPQTITLKTSTSGADIYYTTDGTEPSSGSTKYTGPIEVSGEQGKEEKTVIKAITVKNGLENSPVTSLEYVIKIPHEHSWSIEWSHNGTHHWHDCTNANCSVVLESEKDKYGEHKEVIVPAVAATCTETGLTEGKKCSVCQAIIVAPTVIPALGHTEVIDAAEPATCTETGLTEAKHCSRCGETITEQKVIAALGHIEVVDEAKEPTCTETGLTEGKHCSRCGEKLIEQKVVSAKGHIGITIPGKAATCTEKGLTDGKKCSVCGAVLEEQVEIAALGHTEVIDAAVPATCTEKGKTEGKHCSVCNEVLVAQEETEALGHDWQTDADNPKVDATCTKDGHEAGMKCSRCNAIQAGATIPAKGHTNEIIAGKAATCTESGLTEGKKCSVCGEIIDAPTVIPALGHIEVVDKAKEPTCIETGLTEGKHCSVCNTVLNTQVTVPAKGHTEVIIPGKAASCTETGLTDGKKCSVCGYVIEAQREIAALGHTELVDVAVPATCTEKGKTEGKHCSACGEVLVSQEETEALGHDWQTDADNPRVEATCTEDGHEAGTKCARCGKAKQGEIISAKGHTEEVIAGKAATCTETGLTEGKKCSVCGEIIDAPTVIPALGHIEVVDEAEEPTCTETGLTEGKHCSVCNTVLKAQETVPAKGHTEAIIPGKAATCTETGLTKGKKCSVCGDVIEAQTEIAALGHTEVVDVAVPATCTEKGKTEGKHCSVCNEVLVAQKEIETLGHDWKTDADNPKVEATCTEDGHEAGTKCSRCNSIQAGATIPAKGHTEEIIADKAATCIETGLTEGKKCSVCGETLIVQEEIPALGHTEVVDEAKEPTCTETGLTEGKHCSVCNTVLKAQETVPAKGHTEVMIPGKAATCTGTGLTDGKKCSVCGTVLEAQTEIAALGHTEVVDAAVPATCTEKGKTEGKHCSVCGEVLVSQEDTKALGHDWKTDADNPKVEATCTEDGHEAGTKCTRCGKTQQGEIISAKGHTEETIAGKTATCTEPGLTEGKKCSVCQEIIVAPTVIPVLGHTYGEWTTVKESNCTEKGVKTRTCSVCQNVEQQDIEINHNNHIWASEYTVDKEANCTEAGSKSIHCTKCDARKESEEITKLDHNYGDWITIKEPSCIERGSKKQVCKACSYEKIADISALGHIEDIDAAVPATCTEKGKTEGKHCSVCGEVLVSQKETKALGHDWKTDEDNPRVEATCTEVGHEAGMKCIRCNEIQTGATIPAKGHTEEIIAGKTATCTEPGLTDGKKCSICQAIIVAPTVIPATGHSFENGRCKVCGEIKPGLPSGGGGGTVLPPIHDTDNEEIVVNKKNDTEQTTTAKTGATTEENKDGKLYANTDIDKEIGGEIVEKAVANNSVKIVIQAKPADNTENVSVTEVKMPVETVKAIAKETEAVLIMETQHAEVAFDNKAVETIAEQSKGDTVSILAEIIPEENRTEEQNKAAGDSGVVIELKVQHSNGTVSKFNGGKVTVTMPVPDELYGKKIKAVYVDTDGTYTVVPGKIIFRDGKEYYEFTTEHFSSYVLVEEESADTLISKQNEEFAKIEQGMKVTTIKLKSSVTAKGNIRLSWVKSKGYRVDYYQVFRSTKKGSFGKKAFYVSSDGTKTYYVNSKNLKAGKRYYYKVRGVRNINGRKYYTKWSNVSSKVAA